MARARRRMGWSQRELAARRQRCTALIDRAESRLATGAIDGACADASEALQISADTQHVESLRRVEKLSRTALATRADCARKLFHQVLLIKSENGLDPGPLRDHR
ncbi:MAG: hypothetical protein ACRDRZ_07280 [Pseudonocardiaceae bacterium]